MDHDSHFQDGVDAERLRMNSFSFGKPLSPSGTNAPSRHSRSHSRNSSVSVPVSLPTPVSTSMHDSPPQSPTRNSIGGAKRNSHHRRRSSVSTRRGSADMMGVSLPAIPISNSDDNINLGDRDSVRRRALWALEGKDAGGNFSVEIPELDAPEVPKRSFDFPTKPSFPPGMGAGYGGGLNTLIGSKRDSIGKFMASTPSSELLGTLVEEEEEEEDEIKEVIGSPVKESPVRVTAASTATRPRPASLNLRPLSLALSSSVQVADVSIPIATPSPRPGLKSLTLANSGLNGGSAVNKRQSLILSPSPIPSNRRPALNLMTDSVVASSPPNRRSSISYVSTAGTQTVSAYGLPTPEMTPTSSTIDRHRSTSISSSGSMDLGQLGMQRGRPLSMSEQHFLFQAHETLVQRITDLERALARSSRSRPVSCASDASVTSSTPSEPSDEMLQLIADLKAERDELKRDVDGWRTRVADLQHQIDIHAKRLEVERRDAWVARQRVGLLEVEKSSLEKILSQKTTQTEEAEMRSVAVQAALQISQEDAAYLKAEVERMRGVEDECARLRGELLQERKKREEMEHELEHAGLLDTPRPIHTAPPGVARAFMHTKSRGLGFRSIDSEATDVDSADEDHRPGLKAVEEVDEDDDTTDNDDDDELARYEDEEEGDDEFAFPTSTSYESVMEYSRAATPRLSTDSADSAPPLTLSRSPSASPSPLPSPAEPTHVRNASLSKAWTFPSGSAAVASECRPREEIDRFFGCLEDVDNSPPLDSKLHSVESNKNLFAQALADYEDDIPPFMLPSDVGEIVLSPEVESPQRMLDIVVEEEEEEEEEKEEENDNNYDRNEEFVGEVDEGGIKFTFNPPPSYFTEDEGTSTPEMSMPSTPESANKSGSIFEPIDEDADDASFMFPRLKSQRSSSLPSGIPRLRSPSPSMLPVPVSTPPKVFSFPPRTSPSPTSFATPPAKRAATAPTFIPHPRVPSPSAASRVASFIPQPQRAHISSRPSTIPLMTPPASSRLPHSTSFSTDAISRSVSTTPRPPAASPHMNAAAPLQSQVSSISSSSLPSFVSPTLAARLSFQTLTNFIPVPSLLWSPRSNGGCLDSSATQSSMSSSGSLDHTCATSTFVNATVSAVAKQGSPRERSYVPKERQLERLRLRMEEERKRGWPVGSGLGIEVKKSQLGVLDI